MKYNNLLESGGASGKCTSLTWNGKEQGLFCGQSERCYCWQPMILEVAILNVKPGEGEAFRAAFYEAEKIICTVTGYIHHELQQCIEDANKYILLVKWQTLEAHTHKFRQSKEYQTWKQLLHHFYDPFPEVLHFQAVK